MATFLGPRMSIFATRFCIFMPKYFIPKKAMIRLAPLWRNITICGTKRYALDSQRSQLFNASKFSFQLALEARIKAYLYRKFSNNFPGPEKCLKRNGECILRKAVSDRMFSVVWKCCPISWRNITNCRMKRPALERARTQLSDACKISSQLAREDFGATKPFAKILIKLWSPTQNNTKNVHL